MAGAQYTGDYLSLLLVNGSLIFTYSLGSGDRSHNLHSCKQDLYVSCLQRDDHPRAVLRGAGHVARGERGQTREPGIPAAGRHAGQGEVRWGLTSHITVALD